MKIKNVVGFNKPFGKNNKLFKTIKMRVKLLYLKLSLFSSRPETACNTHQLVQVLVTFFHVFLSPKSTEYMWVNNAEKCRDEV